MSEQLSFTDFVQHIGVMKPNAADKENPRQLAKLDKLLDDPGYAMEDKIDGHRTKIIGSRIFSSDNVEKTDNYPHLRDFFNNLAMHNLILDGEVNFPGKTSQYVQHAAGGLPTSAVHFQKQNGWMHFTAFDMLRTPKGNWLIRNTYLERRKVLQYFYDTFVKGTKLEQFIHLTPVIIQDKRGYLQQLLDQGLEGGVLKKLDGHYFMGKKPMWQWMKFKQEDDVDLIITGFEPAKRDYTGDNLETWKYWKEVNGENIPVTKPYYMGWIGSVNFSAYVSGSLKWICAASGMNEDVRDDMTNNPQKYINKVARVKFMEKTSDGYPRHPVFKNLHETKQPGECTWEF